MVLLLLLLLLLLVLDDPGVADNGGRVGEDGVGRGAVRVRAGMLQADARRPAERIARRYPEQVLALHFDHGAARRARHVGLRRQGRGVGHALPWSRFMGEGASAGWIPSGEPADPRDTGESEK